MTFAYPGAEAPVLSNISFTAEPGQTVAIIGSTGAGKSSLLALLPAPLRRRSGEVLLDGVPVTELDRAEITQRVAMVPQRPYLFSGTIEHNLRFGKPEATDEELWEALTVAQAADFVREKKDGLDCTDRPGRHQRLRRPAPAAVHRPRARHRSPRSSCSTTRSPPSTSPPTPGSAGRSRPRRPTPR